MKQIKHFLLEGESQTLINYLTMKEFNLRKADHQTNNDFKNSWYIFQFLQLYQLCLEPTDYSIYESSTAKITSKSPTNIRKSILKKKCLELFNLPKIFTFSSNFDILIVAYKLQNPIQLNVGAMFRFVSTWYSLPLSLCTDSQFNCQHCSH